MIERITLMKLTEAHTTNQNREVLETTVNRALTGIPELQSFHIGVPSDEASLKSWDLSVVMRAPTSQDMFAALAHPNYQACIQEISALIAVTKAWNFTV